MKIRPGLKNFILFLLLTALVVVGCMELSAPARKAAPFRHTEGAPHTLATPALTGLPDLCEEQVSGRNFSVSFSNITRNIRTGPSGRYVISVLFHMLTLLSVYFSCIKKTILSRDNRFLYQEAFTISYMQDTDGRKRLS